MFAEGKLGKDLPRRSGAGHEGLEPPTSSMPWLPNAYYLATRGSRTRVSRPGRSVPVDPARVTLAIGRAISADTAR
jgi:hypothetical protein